MPELKTAMPSGCHRDGRRISRMGPVRLIAVVGGLVATAMPALGQIAYVQATAKMDLTAGTTVTSTAFPTNPTVGNKIVVAAWTWAYESTACPGVSDNYGNAYTLVASSLTGPNGGYGCAVIFAAPVTTTGSNFKVTVAFKTPGMSSSDQINGLAVEYSGLGASDQVATVTGTAASASVATTAATSAAAELVVGTFSLLAPASNYTTLNASTGYTQRASQLNNAGDVVGSYADKITSSTGVQSVTWTASGSFAQWSAAIATFTASGIGTPDHYAVTHNATGVNCQAEPVTITAHTSAHTALANTQTITISTSTGRGDWSLTTGTGTFAAGASNSGTATYTYASADKGVVVLSLRDTYPETVTVNVAGGAITQTSGSALASENTTLTFAPSGFRITNGSNVATTIGTQQAGVSSSQSLALQAIRTDTNTGACTTAFASGTTVNVPMAYQCNNPTSCVAGQTLSVTNNGTTTSIASNPNSGITTYTNVPLKFSTANAEAPFSLKYSDVGQITLAEKYAIPLGSGVGSSNYMTGSGQFVVQPAGFTLSNIKCTTYGSGTCNTGLASPGNNPGASTAAGSVFMPGGAPFTATVTAINGAGAATPNFGQEISPATVTLAPTLVLPVSGHTGAITNGSAFGAFSAGVATGTTFAWPEAGIITLAASTSSAYLGTSVVTGSASGNVGRFIPARFNTAANTPVLGTACIAGSYSYLGQPLTYTVAPVLTATAVAYDGTTVAQNYTGSLMRLTNSTLTGRSYTPTPAAPALDTSGLPATTVDPLITDQGAGNVSLTFGSGTGLKFSRSSVVVPFSANIALAINVIDADGVTAAANPVTVGSGPGISFSSGATQRYGRLNLADALGSELLDLPMALTTQYYLNATVGFVTNTNDSCTTAPALAFSSYQLHLVAGKTCVRDTGSPGVSGQGCAVAAAVGQRYAATATSGSFNLNLAAPGIGYSGAVTVTATAPAWLQYTWISGGGYSSPTGMATFGIYPGPASRVHQREVY